MKMNRRLGDHEISILIAAIVTLLFFTQAITGITAISLMAIGIMTLFARLVNVSPLYIPIRTNKNK